MKPGNIVMFVDEGRYARWFWGQLGTVVDARVNKKGEEYCRVQWVQPALYHDSHTTYSSFRANCFKVIT